MKSYIYEHEYPDVQWEQGIYSDANMIPQFTHRNFLLVLKKHNELVEEVELLKDSIRRLENEVSNVGESI